MSNYTKKIFKNTLIIFIISNFAFFISYLFRIVLAKNLTVTEVGIFYSVLSFLSLFSLFQDFGIPSSLVKYISEFNVNNEKTKIKSIIMIALIILYSSTILIGLIIIFFSNFIAIHFFHNPSISIFIKLCAISIILSPIMNIFKAIFQSYHESFYYALMDFSQSSLLLILTLIFIHKGIGVYSPFLGYIFMYAVAIIFYIIFIKKIFPDFWKTKFIFDKELRDNLLKFSLMLSLTSAASMFFGYVDTVILTYFRGPYDVAVYNMGYSTIKVFWSVSSTMTIILLPLSSEMWAKKQFDLLKDGIKYLYKYSFIIIIPTSLVFLIYPEFILTLLFGSEYIQGAIILRLLGIGTIFFTIFQINIAIFTGIGKPNEITKIMLIAAIINLTGCLILIPKYGITGATISTFVSFLFLSLISFFKLKKEIKLIFDFKELVLILINSSLLFLVSFLIKKYIHLNMWPIFIISVIIGIVVYISGLFLFKIINLDEIKSIISRIKS